MTRAPILSNNITLVETPREHIYIDAIQLLYFYRHNSRKTISKLKSTLSRCAAMIWLHKHKRENRKHGYCLSSLRLGLESLQLWVQENSCKCNRGTYTHKGKQLAVRLQRNATNQKERETSASSSKVTEGVDRRNRCPEEQHWCYNNHDTLNTVAHRMSNRRHHRQNHVRHLQQNQTRNNEILKTASEHVHKGNERIHRGTKS